MKKKATTINFSKVKFGRLPVIEDARTFELSGYLHKEQLPRIPKRYNWGRKIRDKKWGDLGNLKINLCTCSVAGHFVMAWTSNIGRLKRPKDEAILNAYSIVSGYDPKKPEIDEGVEAIKLLKYWRKKEIAGHRIIAFAKLEDKNREQLIQTIYLFGGCYVGVNLPKSAERQFNTTKKWTIPRGGKKKDAKAGSWFGHAVLIVGYKDEELRIVTWGEEITMTMDFWETYSVESYAVFSEAFIRDDKTPTGVDINVLRNDIETLQKRKAGN